MTTGVSPEPVGEEGRYTVQYGEDPEEPLVAVGFCPGPDGENTWLLLYEAEEVVGFVEGLLGALDAGLRSRADFTLWRRELEATGEEGG